MSERRFFVARGIDARLLCVTRWDQIGPGGPSRWSQLRPSSAGRGGGPTGEGRNEGSHGAHRYSFRLYALDGELAVGSDLGRRDLERAMKGCVLEVAEPVGTHRR